MHSAFSQVVEEVEMSSKEFRPSIGLGIGMINFFGDVNSNANHGAFYNQIGYSLHIDRKINEYADLGFTFLTGTIVGNERSADRNLNFKTNIYSGAVHATYNFYHFLPEAAILHPYLTIGFESFEYNNKADLVDANGNPYFYWTDGTVRSLDQESPFASQAVLMQRDYVYETDLRAADLDGLGKYPQLSMGIPIGIGANLNITQRTTFRIGSTFHFTFTDLIDNVSSAGIGVRKGNSSADFFAFNSFSLHYDLINAPKSVNPEDFRFPDYFVLDMMDMDNDGVVDGLDLCPATPQGVMVDKNGCPYDDDNDGVPNYIDLESGTSENAFVNKEGVTLTDDDFLNWYLRYIDSLDVPLEILYKIAGKPQKAATYRILLGEFTGSLPKDLANSFLAEGDVIGALTKSGSTAYLAGKYGDVGSAERRKAELLAKGMPEATVVVWEGNEFITLKEWEDQQEAELKDLYKEEIQNKENLEGMYAVKLGETAADADKLDVSQFYKEENVIELPGVQNSKDYVVGPFIDSVGASQVLEDLYKEKYPNAEVVKVVNSKIVESQEVKDVESQKVISADERRKEKSNKIISGLEGAFVIDFGSKEDPKTKAAIDRIKEKVDVVEVVDATNGTTKLISNEPKSQYVVEKEVAKLKDEGIKTAKVVQVKNGELIQVPVKEESILDKLEDATVIDLGFEDEVNQKELQQKIEDSYTVEKVMDQQTGRNKIIAVADKSDEELEKDALKFNKEGTIEAQVAKVKNGNIIPLEDGAEREISNKMEDSFVIDLGFENEVNQNDIQQKIENSYSIEKVIDQQTGKTKIIAIADKPKEELKKDVQKLNKEGVPTAQIAKIKNGKVIPLHVESITETAKENILNKLEDSFVIDFGNAKSEKTKATIEAIKLQNEVVEIKDEKTGEVKLITTDPKSKIEVQKQIEEIVSKGVTEVKLAQVRNGKLVSVDNKEVSSLSNSKEDLKGLENQFVVKIGTVTSETSLVEKEKLLSQPNTIQVKNPDGSIDVLTKTSFKEEEPAHDQKKKLKALGFTNAKIAYVKNGNVEVLKKEELDGKYTLSLGSFKSDISSEDVNKIASISDVESMETFNPDVTTYTVGNFDSPEEAKKRLQELVGQGFSPELVKYEDGKIKNIDLKSVYDSSTLLALETAKKEQGLLNTGEVVFRVQLGAYRGKIKESVFDGVKTLSFPAPGGITKYVTGSFNTYQLAYLHKLDMRKRGFEGAFVVAYKDGKRISVTDLVNHEEYKQVKERVSPVEKELNKVPQNIQETKRIEDKTSNASAVRYKVQIGAFKDETIEGRLTIYPDVSMEVYGQYKRYLAGNFESYKEANELKQKIVENGFSGAFIVAYDREERVAVPGVNPNIIKSTDVQSKEDKVSNTSEYDKSKLLILVQVGLYKGDIPQDLKTLFNSLPDITRQVTPHGVVRYMTGKFNNLSEAAAYKEELITKGFDGAFLVAYYDNERITIQKAIEIFQSQ